MIILEGRHIHLEPSGETARQAVSLVDAAAPFKSRNVIDRQDNAEVNALPGRDHPFPLKPALAVHDEG